MVVRESDTGIGTDIDTGIDIGTDTGTDIDKCKEFGIGIDTRKGIRIHHPHRNSCIQCMFFYLSLLEQSTRDDIFRKIYLWNRTMVVPHHGTD